MLWFDRSFVSDLSPLMFPNIVERLRGTPARIEELLRDIPAAVLTRRFKDGWSIQENAGHLWDLEDLWMARVRDLQSGRTEFIPADLTNQRTWDRKHNDASILSLHFSSDRCTPPSAPFASEPPTNSE